MPSHKGWLVMVPEAAAFRQSGEKMIGFFGCGDPQSEWRPVTFVDLHGPEPDWEAIERQ